VTVARVAAITYGKPADDPSLKAAVTAGDSKAHAPKSGAPPYKRKKAPDDAGAFRLLI